jgi:hypothetical protein
MKYPDLTSKVLLALCSRMELKDLPYLDASDQECLAAHVVDLAKAIADEYHYQFNDPDGSWADDDDDDDEETIGDPE